jgi:hypothetical protein
MIVGWVFDFGWTLACFTMLCRVRGRGTYRNRECGLGRDHPCLLLKTHLPLLQLQIPYRGQLPSHDPTWVWEQDPYFGTCTIVGLPSAWSLVHYSHGPRIKGGEAKKRDILVVLNAARSPRSFPFTSLPPNT